MMLRPLDASCARRGNSCVDRVARSRLHFGRRAAYRFHKSRAGWGHDDESSANVGQGRASRHRRGRVPHGHRQRAWPAHRSHSGAQCRERRHRQVACTNRSASVAATASTPNSSSFIIARDPFRAIRRGRQLFQRKFTRTQGQGPLSATAAATSKRESGDRRRSRGQLRGVSRPARADRPASAATSSRGPTAATRRICSGWASRRCWPTRSPPIFGRSVRRRSPRRAQRSRRSTSALGSKGIDYGSSPRCPMASSTPRGVEGVDADLRVRPFFAPWRHVLDPRVRRRRAE